ncbi:MAG: DNA-3-methyladenine glycosylase [Promethearchaeota archaeon]
MKEFKRLTRDFFSRDTQLIAKDILGKYLIRNTVNGTMVGKIIEVEAYLGPEDKACHCYNYKKTEKTKIMYMKPGTLYVYYIYGTYFCLNVITEPEDIPCAIFIRALYPIDGIDIMKKNRTVKLGKNYKNLVDGPSKLCMAFNISKDLFNGRDSCSKDTHLYFSEGEKINKSNIVLHKRVGIDYAEEDKNRLLRFSLKI